MTTDEAITDLEILLANIPKYIRSYRSIEMGIKALKQYGALQDIQHEIEQSKHYKGKSGNSFIDAHNVGLDKYFDLGIEKALKIIDKHIKEIEGSDTECMKSLVQENHQEKQK